MTTSHLVLAGGGHSHALILKRWAMKPHLRPRGLITLVNRNSTTIYSGMVPGLIAGHYKRDEVVIDLRALSMSSGVSFINAEIIGLDMSTKCLFLADRPPIRFHTLSLDVGAETLDTYQPLGLSRGALSMPIKPLEPALNWLDDQDSQEQLPFTIIGSGLAGIEIAMALRHRWPSRKLSLHAYTDRISAQLKKALVDACINVLPTGLDINGPTLLCTGSQAPMWLAASGLPVNSFGRVITNDNLQVIAHPCLFAVGDCAVIQNFPRPASGVWAVRVAQPLAKNLERLSRNLPLKSWSPQRHSLQLIGAQINGHGSTAWAWYRKRTFGSHPLLWYLKEFIDKRFIAGFSQLPSMQKNIQVKDVFTSCRGCAAKLPAELLKESLSQAGLGCLVNQPRDAVEIDCHEKEGGLLQSVDGFPALVSDPWLNGCLTALHACSDIWASGAKVVSAQALITLPSTSSEVQKELLTQTIAGIQAALEPQGACLIGGHTFEARSVAPDPVSLGIQVEMCVNGRLEPNTNSWKKEGLQRGDKLLLSKPLGTGVLFAAAMSGSESSKFLDKTISQMLISQHKLLDWMLSLQKATPKHHPIHACTDITGFGLLGHLGEMISASNKFLSDVGKAPCLRVHLKAAAIPVLDGALELIDDGYCSTLAPANRSAWEMLKVRDHALPDIDISFEGIAFESRYQKALLELIVDPQTCGPLLVACSQITARTFLKTGCWHDIGSVI